MYEGNKVWAMWFSYNFPNIWRKFPFMSRKVQLRVWGSECKCLLSFSSFKNIYRSERTRLSSLYMRVGYKEALGKDSGPLVIPRSSSPRCTTPKSDNIWRVLIISYIQILDLKKFNIRLLREPVLFSYSNLNLQRPNSF